MGHGQFIKIASRRNSPAVFGMIRKRRLTHAVVIFRRSNSPALGMVRKRRPTHAVVVVFRRSNPQVVLGMVRKQPPTKQPPRTKEVLAAVRRRGAAGKCGSLSAAIPDRNTTSRATGLIGAIPDLLASVPSWSGRTMSARLSDNRTATGSSNPVTTGMRCAHARVRSPAPLRSAGDENAVKSS